MNIAVLSQGLLSVIVGDIFFRGLKKRRTTSKVIIWKTKVFKKIPAIMAEN